MQSDKHALQTNYIAIKNIYIANVLRCSLICKQNFSTRKQLAKNDTRTESKMYGYEKHRNYIKENTICI